MNPIKPNPYHIYVLSSLESAAAAGPAAAAHCIWLRVVSDSIFDVVNDAFVRFVSTPESGRWREDNHIILLRLGGPPDDTESVRL